MSQSLMVYPGNNDFLHMPTMLDDNVAKLMNAEQIENYLASASTSPAQDYIMSPTSYHPQQDQQNQRQHQLQFSAATMISHSAPNSPPYPIIKTEDAQAQNTVDYSLMFPTTFDVSAQDQQVLPSQRQYANVTLLQQHQQHKQQQQQHEQQLRMQHRQLQMMYDPAVTSSIMSTMVSAATSTSIFAPTAITTSAPFVHAPILAQDAPTFQRRPTYTPAAHPAAPKQRKREELAESDEPTSPSTPKVKITRSTKVLKSSSPSSPVSSFSSLTDASETSKAKKVAIKKAISESRESSEQPDDAASYPSRTPGHTNVTHPRRAAQNRAAQRTFRNRRKAYIKELEVKVSEIDKTRELMEAVQAENREVWRRLQMLENLASRNGLQLPVFPPLTSLAATTLSADGVSSISVVAGNDYTNDMMMLNHPNHLGHSDNE